MARNTADSNITIKDIAALCGVSISTVSNVLNGKTNKVSADVCKKVLDAVEKTNYRPNYLAKNLRSISTKTIGVIAEDLILFSASPIIEGIMNACEEKGYNVIIENMRLFGRWNDVWMKDEALFQSALQPVLTKMESMNVDGIVYVGGHEHKVSGLNLITNIPIVMAYCYSDDENIISFRPDDQTGGLDAINYLFSMGHKEIGIITGESDNPHTINRLIGVQKAFFDNGLLFNPALISYQHWSKEGGYDGMKYLLNQKISAVFCMSDAIASGAYAALSESNLVPGKDISIIGFDNQDVSYFLTPRLTTMALPLEDIGYHAVCAVIDKVEGIEKSIDTNSRIKSTLIIRDSVAKI